jgi:hypothetical protein
MRVLVTAVKETKIRGESGKQNTRMVAVRLITVSVAIVIGAHRLR